MVKKILIEKGKKKLFGKIGPSRAIFETFYQKGRSMFGSHLEFNPSNYKGENYEEKQRFAYEDAKNHKKLYDELIQEGVYPRGTRVKIKKIRHSDRYTIEMTMPEIYDMFRYNRLWLSKEYGKEAEELNNKMREIAEKYHMNRLHSDAGREMNYGIDPKTKKIVYMDYEFLPDNLPFERRKSEEEIAIERRDKRIKQSQNYSLEKRIVSTFFLLIIAIGLISSTSTITGNIIGFSNTYNLSGTLLIFIGIIGFLFNQKYKQ